MNNDKNLNLDEIRNNFPIFKRQVNGKSLCYLDSGASSQQPNCVIDSVCNLHKNQYSNIHRGVHVLSMESTTLYEESREKVKNFINADSSKEIIFTRGATESINLVAQSQVRVNLKEGDEVLISHMEHHSNIVPWQLVCNEAKASLKVIPINDKGELDLDHFNSLINEKTKMVALTHISNALGTVNPIKKIIEISHNNGSLVLIDGAQGAPHSIVDVQDLDVDFYVFSGHKLYGPTGIGILYGKKHLLEKMPPYQGGGDMILSVRFEETQYNDLPYKFEAGTPNISGAVGLGKAIDFINEVGLAKIIEHEDNLLDYAIKELQEIKEVKIIGNADKKAALVSFIIDGIHPHDIGQFFDQDGIAIRAGHHCAQPVMERYGIPATARASFGMYNIFSDVDRLINSIKNVIRIFK
ncbi:MAG: cysteine desulfurase [Verrucomicrobiota bacterium]|nr:cysteine desulfurase [Verrucomicrobiota bacterium]